MNYRASFIGAVVTLLGCAATTARAQATPGSRYEAAVSLWSTADGDPQAIAATIESLKRLVDAEDTTPVVRRDAFHLLGRVLQSQGAWSESTAALEQALALGSRRGSRTSLKDTITLALARNRVSMGEGGSARKLLRRVQRATTTRVKPDAWLLRARSWLGIDLTKTPAKSAMRRAARDYRGFVEKWPDAPGARDAAMEATRLELNLGRYEAAISTLRDVLLVSPASRAGMAAAALVDALGRHQKQARERTRDQVEWLIGERRFDEAIPRVQALLDEAIAKHSSRREAAARTMALEIAWQQRDLQAALPHHAWFLSREGKGLSPWKLARLQAFAGEFAKAEETILADHDGRKLRSYWEDLGDLRFEFGRYRPAYRAYYNARRRRGRKDRKPSENMVWCRLRMGDYAAFAEYFGVGARRRGQSRLRERYWYARAKHLSGDDDEARRVFDGLVEDAPLSYYGVVAGSRIAEMEGRAPTVGEGQPVAGVYWGTERAVGAFSEGPQRASRAEILGHLKALDEKWGELLPHTARALEFATLARYEEAASELRVIDMDLRTLRSRGSSALAKRAPADLLDNRRTQRARGGASIKGKSRYGRKALRKIKRHRRDVLSDLRPAQIALADPYAMRRSVFESGGLSEVPITDPRWRSAYPIAYGETMAAFTEQFDVPPYYLYAVMTVESAFHPHPISVSNAYGLLQVIPRTGRRVAEELDFPEFSPELLLKPDVGIYFGGYYLAQVLAKFKGQEQLAAAAYNAGPHRVSDWLNARGTGPLDMFIEEIPFRQARGYARTMTSNIARYRKIYQGQDTYVSNALIREHLPMPNY